MSAIGMTLLLSTTLAFFSWSTFRRMRQLSEGAFDPTFSIEGTLLVDRIRDTFIYAFGQRKMPYYRLAGLAHMAIFGGFMVLALNSVILWGRGFDPYFDFWGLFARGTLLGDGYSFLKEVFAAGVLVGVSVFIYYRVGLKGADSVVGRPRMTLGIEGLIILGIIGTMMIADFAYVGAQLALEAQALGHTTHFHPAEPIGSLFGMGFAGIESRSTLKMIEHVGFWWHAAFVLIFLNLLPYSKHFHVITAIPNVFTYPRNPAALPKVDDLEGKVEREESLGVAKVRDLSWNHILDLYTCTECGRCSDNCPAYITDKKLSPKHFTLALRDHLYASEGHMFSDAVVEPGDAPQAPNTPEDGEEIHTFPKPPAGGYFLQMDPELELVPNVLHPDVIWACTSCRACEEQCPVMISYVDKIVGMRREEVMMKNEFPTELMGAFQGIETNGNPWNLSSLDRGDWTDTLRSEGIQIPTLAEHPHADVLYWVGCAASFDDRAKKVARSVAKLLHHAGVDFAILGTEETCTGDPARRAGNEYLFQMMAEQNVETMNGYEVASKTVITACPHCFNTIANEYSQFGGHFQVVHHSEFLNGLISAGKIRPTKPVEGEVVFHDSCYLGRYNQVYDSPRQVLESIPGVQLREVDYWNRNRGLCCGAGGAQMWMEEQNENRVNAKRTLQLLDTGATTVASGCPFCMTMLSDGLKAQEKDEEIQQLDLAELLVRSVDFGTPARSTTHSDATDAPD